ncbi:hypothetical protein HZB02_07555 [Candidatus Woesearchaeota archaeon]|nr:hypothetical protein [Candidatus Woesearchaeota archaeon]
MGLKRTILEEWRMLRNAIRCYQRSPLNKSYPYGNIFAIVDAIEERYGDLKEKRAAIQQKKEEDQIQRYETNAICLERLVQALGKDVHVEFPLYKPEDLYFWTHVVALVISGMPQPETVKDGIVLKVSATIESTGKCGRRVGGDDTLRDHLWLPTEPTRETYEKIYFLPYGSIKPLSR